METSDTSNCKHWSKICNFSKECEKSNSNKKHTATGNRVDRRRKVGSQSLQIDTSMDEVEETRFRIKFAPLIRQILPTVHFTYFELEILLIIYYKIQKKNGERALGMTRAQFRDILHNTFDMTDGSMMERIFQALDSKGPKVGTSGQIVSMQSWAFTMSLFLRGTLEEKIEYCYSVYDQRNEGLLTRDNIFKLLRLGAINVGEDESDEAIKDIAEIVTKKLDLDHDGKVSFEDFRKSVLKSPMLLEILGPCLPSRSAIHAFLTTFTEITGKM